MKRFLPLLLVSLILASCNKIVYNDTRSFNNSTWMRFEPETFEFSVKNIEKCYNIVATVKIDTTLYKGFDFPLVVDMQNDYITGSMGTPEARGILGAVKDRIERARAEGDAICFTRDTHGANYLQTQEGRRNPTLHCQIDTDGWEIADGLFAEGDITLIGKDLKLVQTPTGVSVRRQTGLVLVVY